MSLVGPEVKVGDKAPNAPLRGNAMEKVELNFADGKTRVLTFVPSLDTPTCSVQTRRFNSGASRLAEDVEVLVISRDLPYAQARFCGANGLERVITYSDFVAGEFGKAWGFYVQETDLLARVVVVVDQGGIVRYLQVVEDLSEQPDYADAMEALKAVVPASVKDAEEEAEVVEPPADEEAP